MSTGVRVGAFGGLLVALFALAALAGRALDPDTTTGDAPPDHAAHAAPAAAGHDHAAPEAVAGGGLRLVTGDTTLPAGRSGRLAFRVVDERGATLRAFQTEQARRMHLVVVRRDLRRFQHLHPKQDADGGWSVRLTLPDAGVYHAFADFKAGGARHTLGVDLFAGGRFDPLVLPPLSTSSTVDGYQVALLEARAGELRFDVRRDGATVRDLQPYLGAAGHLVMLRSGDLAYQHVHPLAGDALAFDTATAPAGRYRLFLQFRHRGAVHTAAFTHAVA